MGILDIQTMQQIANELKALYPNIYLYGEGWQMDTGLASERLAHQYNAAQLPDYGFFSDHFRDSLKQTIAQGRQIESKTPASQLENVLTADVGLKGEAHFTAPQQAINYVECHDNATVFDYFDIWTKDIGFISKMPSLRKKRKNCFKLDSIRLVEEAA